MDKIGRELAQALAKPGEADWAAALQALTAELVADAPYLTADTLHDFRGRAKAARYLAELSARRDARTARQAAECKAIQTVAGAWHDWHVLATEAAGNALGDTSGSLCRLLAAIAERSLTLALDECRCIAAQWRKESARSDIAHIEQVKRTVRRAEPPTAIGEKHRA